MRLNDTARNHWRHHNRFYISAAVGGVAWMAGWTLDPQLRLVLAGDVFYAAYLIWAFVLIDRLRPAEMRKRSAVEDEGTLLIMVLTLGTIVFSLVSLFGIFGHDTEVHPALLAATVASVPLGWFTLHVFFAFRYAHLYYERGKGKTARDAGGLAFPNCPEPTAWDFVYHAFVVGATAQVSDVQVTSTQVRRLTWAHSMIAFFYNTVLIALAVNIAVQSAG